MQRKSLHPSCAAIFLAFKWQVVVQSPYYINGFLLATQFVPVVSYVVRVLSASGVLLLKSIRPVPATPLSISNAPIPAISSDHLFTSELH